MVIGEVPSRSCRYCDDEPCEWVQYSRDITGSRLRMLTCSHRRLTSRLVTRTLSQHYYYKKYGQLSKKTRIRLPFCVERGIQRLDNAVSRVCTVGSPPAAEQTESSAERTVSEVGVSA
ncbi:hypothetical protein L917_03440 [Phytophthora nicotianae]|uniref:Uncharacterized protein n=1 Tax=Phytophthora nicotianae TaxID=4792 RepID=W2NWF9_PHYNI|nr:hypothetical protein L917_03440 [Phytophthora nicotianae]ETM52916.1 hypothetical protein L914_03552 [Phytophthora nicotianae]